MPNFEGLRVLIVEDEELVAMMVEAMVEDLGCVVAASIRNIPDAIAAIESEKFQIALLDVNLSGKQVFPVSEKLREKQIPFIFSSGYGADAVPEPFNDAPLIPKPFRMEELAEAISQALRRM